MQVFTSSQVFTITCVFLYDLYTLNSRQIKLKLKQVNTCDNLY